MKKSRLFGAVCACAIILYSITVCELAAASVVVTQDVSRAQFIVHLLNFKQGDPLLGQQGVANSQVNSNHTLYSVMQFDSSSLSNIDVVYLSPDRNNESNLNLTLAEEDALVDFTSGGGRLIIAADNSDLWADSFRSIAARFDTNYGSGDLPNGTVTVTNFVNPITNGPAGIVNSFSVAHPNDGLASTNPKFLSLANYSNGASALGYLIFGLGEVVFLTDINTFADSALASYDNNILWTNLFEYTAPVPIPPSVWLFGSGLLGLAGMARRKS